MTIQQIAPKERLEYKRKRKKKYRVGLHRRPLLLEASPHEERKGERAAAAAAAASGADPRRHPTPEGRRSRISLLMPGISHQWGTRV